MWRLVNMTNADIPLRSRYYCLFVIISSRGTNYDVTFMRMVLVIKASNESEESVCMEAALFKSQCRQCCRLSQKLRSVGRCLRLKPGNSWLLVAPPTTSLGYLHSTE